MKKFLITALLAGTSLGLYSCNNGAYDVDEKDKGGLNPTNPTSGTTLPLGNAKITVNGVEYLFYPGYYVDTVFNFDGNKRPFFYAWAYKPNDAPFNRTISISFRHVEGKTPDATDKTVGDVLYFYVDTFAKDTVFYAAYDMNFDTSNLSFASAKINGTEMDNLRGKVNYGALKALPWYDEDDDNSPIKPAPVRDSIIYISGEFHLPRWRNNK